MRHQAPGAHLLLPPLRQGGRALRLPGSCRLLPGLLGGRALRPGRRLCLCACLCLLSRHILTLAADAGEQLHSGCSISHAPHRKRNTL